ncbi:MAG: short-chain dehydrogenase [Halieaceae bacterium]|nr:short-chain dehydrogenase [Halieaceae bacterium]|tara:strand:+ start:103 stop:882 length:780 start_codon:yes stop_codon:yes gene_type:complete
MGAEKTCLVIGAGAGIGGSVGKKFAAGGYHAALCRRSDIDGLNTMVSGLQEAGMSASGHLLNAVDEGALEGLIEEVEAIGPIDTVLYNLGAQIGNRSLDDTPLKTFELGWRMACFGLFRVAKVLVPLMVERGHGTILVTSATAAVRGNSGQHSHAAAMAGRRLLCQSLNAEYAAQGVHVVHILIDGAVDAPDTLGKMLGPENFEALREARGKGKDGLLLPDKMAETYYHLAQQHRSAWTHELDLRAHSDLAWWNHAVNL